MANIAAVLTDVALTNILNSLDTSSEFVFVKRFEVSETASALDPARVLASMNTSWFSAPISGRDDFAPNYITVRCTIPPLSTITNKNAAEVYIIGENSAGAEFLFAIGQPGVGGIIYDYQGALSFRFKIPIISSNLPAIQFQYTQATEVSDHNVDPNAHTDIISAIAKAGIPIPIANHAYIGQHYDEKANLDASITQDGLVYKANDGKYYYAIADGTNKSKVAGFAVFSLGIVVVSGFISSAIMLANNGKQLFLSDVTPGLISDAASIAPVGLSHGNNLFAFNGLGVGGSGNAAIEIIQEDDFYQDFLDGSIFKNVTFDMFDNQDLTDTGNTTMTYSITTHKYTFIASQILQSKNLFDTVSGLSSISHCMVYADYTDTVAPTIEVSANGGTNWETAQVGTIHVFVNQGNDLRIRYIAGGTGNIKHWGVLYNQSVNDIPTASSTRKILSLYYEAVLNDEAIVSNIISFDNNVIIDKISFSLRVPCSGSDIIIDILKNDIEQGLTLTIPSGVKEVSIRLPTSQGFIANTDKYGLKIKQIGSTTPGEGLNALTHYIDT